jgi:proteic killer suppression protein
MAISVRTCATASNESYSFLNQAETLDELDIPGYRLHSLTGDRKSTWSIRVTGNWRVMFLFADGDVFDANLEDYH